MVPFVTGTPTQLDCDEVTVYTDATSNEWCVALLTIAILYQGLNQLVPSCLSQQNLIIILIDILLDFQ